MKVSIVFTFASWRLNTLPLVSPPSTKSLRPLLSVLPQRVDALCHHSSSTTPPCPASAALSAEYGSPRSQAKQEIGVTSRGGCDRASQPGPPLLASGTHPWDGHMQHQIVALQTCAGRPQHVALKHPTGLGRELAAALKPLAARRPNALALWLKIRQTGCADLKRVG